MKWFGVQIFVLALACFASGCTPVYVSKTKEFSAQIKAKLDPAKLQAWALKVLPQHINDNEVPLSEVPEEVKTCFDPPPAVLLAGWEGIPEQALMISWGSGFGHWGIVVGSKSFPMPRDTDRNYYVPWVPGVFFYHQKK